MVGKLFILTGASGSGKTTIASQMQKIFSPSSLMFFHFDSIGIPSFEEMKKRYGSQEEWQKAKTLEWMRTIKDQYLDKNNVLLEGQMRIAFIKEALTSTGIFDCQIILVDCNDEVRKERITQNRDQAHLANEQMMNWAAFLRNEAKKENYLILDTSCLSIEQSISFMSSI